MRVFNFTPEVVAEIRHDRYHYPHPRVQRKMEVLWLKSRGLTDAEVAELADVSPRSVQRYLDEFQAGGLEQVRRIDEQDRTPAALGLFQPGLELISKELDLLVVVPLGRHRPYLAPGETNFFFKKARTWDRPRRMPVKRSMACWASLALLGGCWRK